MLNTYKFNVQEYSDTLNFLEEYRQQWGIFTQDFRFMPAVGVHPTESDSVNIKFIWGTDGSILTDNFLSYASYFRNTTELPGLANDYYMLIPMSVPTTFVYTPVTQSSPIIYYCNLPVSLVVSPTTANLITLYFDTPIESNDFYIPVSDFLVTSVEESLIPRATTTIISGDWPNAINVDYSNSIADISNAYYECSTDTATITKAISVYGSKGIAFSIVPNTYNSYTEDVTVDVTIPTIVGTKYKVTLSTSIDLPLSEFLARDSSHSYVQTITTSGITLIDNPYYNLSIIFTATTDTSILSFGALYIPSDFYILIDVSLEVTPPTTSVGYIKCSQYKWLYDNNFPSVSTPILHNKTFENYLTDQVVEFSLLQYDFTPVQSVLNSTDHYNEGNLVSLWEDYHGIVSIGTGYMPTDNVNNTELVAVHDSARAWITEILDQLYVVIPQIEEDAQYAKIVASFHSRSPLGYANTKNFIPRSNIRENEEILFAEVVPESTSVAVPEPVVIDSVTDIVNDWDSGYSNLVEANLITMAQNLLENERVSIEKLLVTNAAEATNLKIVKSQLELAQENKDKLGLNDVKYYMTHEGSTGVLYGVLTTKKPYQTYYHKLTGATIFSLQNIIDYGWGAALIPEQKEWVDRVAKSASIFDEQIAALPSVSAELDVLNGVQESLYNKWVDIKTNSYTVDAIYDKAKSLLGDITSGSLKDTDGNLLTIDLDTLKESVVDVIDGPEVLDDWFKSAAADALTKGEDSVIASNYLGYTQLDKTGYSIAISDANKSYISEDGSSFTNEYFTFNYGDDVTLSATDTINYGQESTIAHETQHLFNAYFTPVSFSKYDFDSGYVYGEGGSDNSTSTSWTENIATLAALEPLDGTTANVDISTEGITVKYDTYKYSKGRSSFTASTTKTKEWVGGTPTSDEIAAMQKQLADQNYVPELLVKSTEDTVNSVSESVEFKYAEEASEETSAMKLRNLYKRKKDLQEKRGL